MEQLALWDADFLAKSLMESRKPQRGNKRLAGGEGGIRTLEMAEKEGFEPSRPVYVDLRP